MNWEPLFSLISYLSLLLFFLIFYKLWLEAAHVMGQSGLAMHWRAHAWMLRFSFQLRDWPETAGQFLRLALVPLGHGLGRLPPGNTGRSHVSALRPMEVSTPVADLITAALEQQ